MTRAVFPRPDGGLEVEAVGEVGPFHKVAAGEAEEGGFHISKQLHDVGAEACGRPAAQRLAGAFLEHRRKQRYEIDVDRPLGRTGNHEIVLVADGVSSPVLKRDLVLRPLIRDRGHRRAGMNCFPVVGFNIHR